MYILLTFQNSHARAKVFQLQLTEPYMHKTRINGEAGYTFYTSISIRRNCEQPFRVLASIHFPAASKTWVIVPPYPVYYRDPLASLSHFSNSAAYSTVPHSMLSAFTWRGGEGKALASTYIRSFTDDPFTKCLFATTETADRIRDVASRFRGISIIGWPATSCPIQNGTCPHSSHRTSFMQNVVRAPIIPNPGGACCQIRKVNDGLPV